MHSIRIDIELIQRTLINGHNTCVANIKDAYRTKRGSLIVQTLLSFKLGRKVQLKPIYNQFELHSLSILPQALFLISYYYTT